MANASGKVLEKPQGKIVQKFTKNSSLPVQSIVPGKM